MSDDIGKLSTEMTAAATDFLDALDGAQRQQANLPFEDDTERRRWYYTPNQRTGLTSFEMRARQRTKALKLLSTGLSEAGYNAAAVLFSMDDLLIRREQWRERPYPMRPGDWMFRDPTMYFFAVFGTPGGSAPWGWRIGGHHVSLQYTITPDFIYATPCFLGANPAIAPLPGGRVNRPLGAEEDFARDLLALLRPDQLSQAIISPAAPTDIVQSNRSTIEEGVLPLPAGVMMGAPATVDGDRLRQELGLTPEMDEILRFSFTPKGLPSASMDGAQRAGLQRLIGLYLERVPEAIAAQYAALLETEAPSFAWAGPVDRGGLHYYRIQSERLLIEYDNTQDGGNHIHSVWRDRVADFGGDVLAKHYASAH